MTGPWLSKTTPFTWYPPWANTMTVRLSQRVKAEIILFIGLRVLVIVLELCSNVLCTNVVSQKYPLSRARPIYIKEL